MKNCCPFYLNCVCYNNNEYFWDSVVPFFEGPTTQNSLNMLFKNETKEKFEVFLVTEANLSASLTEKLAESIAPVLQKDVKNVVLNLKNVATLDLDSCAILSTLQQNFYDNQASFVICEVQTPVEEVFEQSGFLEVMNITPTESEAWDIVQMEEIERELFGGDDSEAAI